MAHCNKCGTYVEESGMMLHLNICKENKEPTPEDKAFEAIECKQKECQVHPLLNPNSTHYQMVDGVEAIERMEQMYSTEELMIWAKMTAMKYRLRIGKKDDVTKESIKIDTYEAYYTYLKDKCHK